MGTIAQKLAAALASKAAIKAAIEAKGVTDVGDVLSDYASKIAAIPTGGGGHSDTAHLVRWGDFDGTILKEEWVEDGEAATPPENPADRPLANGETLQFDKWNHEASSYNAVYSDLEIGALRKTSDGKTYIKVVKVPAGTDVTFSLTLPDVTGTVDWGDGTVENVAASSSAHDMSHSYASQFTGFIIIDSQEDDTVSRTLSFINKTIKNYAVGIYMGQQLWRAPRVSGSSSSSSNLVLMELSLPSKFGGFVQMSYDYYRARNLRGIVIPYHNSGKDTKLTLQIDGWTGLSFLSTPKDQNCSFAFDLYENQNLERLVIPEGTTSVANIQYCRNIRKVTYPDSFTTIELAVPEVVSLRTGRIQFNIAVVYLTDVRLTKLTVKGTVYTSYDSLPLEKTPLTKESIIHLFEHLETVTSTKTITLPGFLGYSDEEIAIATSKGYTVAKAE